MAKTILITAIEASGDRLGAGLMAELEKAHKGLRFIGLGGPEMHQQGLKSLFPMSDLSMMGLVEIIPAIPRVMNRMKQLTELALLEKPDLILTIDGYDFSSRLATRLKKVLPDVPHLHYVAPKIWAWRQGRAVKLKTLFTHILSNLPFEESFYKKYGIPTTYVGHPAITLVGKPAESPSTPTLALLPGSRAGEIEKHWPLFLATYRRLISEIRPLAATLILPEKRHVELCQKAAHWTKADNITVVTGEDRFAALRRSTAALTKSGTNNLEIALMGIPAVVVYKMNSITHAIAKHLIKVPFISLPNLILHYAGQKEAYPEFIQNTATIENLSENILPLLQNKPSAATQRTRLKALVKLMATPKPTAALAANSVSKYLK